MIKAKTWLGWFIHLLAHPIEWLIKKVKAIKEQHKKFFHVFAGIALIMFGAFLASLHQTFVPHFVWDGFAYSIHGAGAAPIIKIVCQLISVEV